MFVETHPFPYLKSGQYAGRGDGTIVFLDKNIPDEKKEWLREEYKKWWDEREEEKMKNLKSGW